VPKARTILMVGIVLVIAAAAYVLLFPKSDEFSNGYSELKQIWAKQGIDIEKVDFDKDLQVSSLNPLEINEMKSSVQTFYNKANTKCSSASKCNSPEDSALKDLATIHLNVLGIVEKINALSDKSYELEFDSTNYQTLCVESRAKLDELISTGDFIISDSQENNSLIKNFNKNYSKEFNIDVSNLSFEASELNTSLSALKGQEASFNEKCGA
jgi:hypothetical protein